MQEGREGRAKYLRMGGAAGAEVGETAPENDNAPAFTVTRGQLGELVRGAVAEAMAEAAGAVAPALLDRQQLGVVLGCSPAMVDKLRKQGMPAVMLGSSPRFEAADCLGWLRAGGGAEKASGQ